MRDAAIDALQVIGMIAVLAVGVLLVHEIPESARNALSALLLVYGLCLISWKVFTRVRPARAHHVRTKLSGAVTWCDGQLRGRSRDASRHRQG
ncbi:hypothetical protein [Kineosporia sp. NBRC 101731]|uniref:hypothetical protein n=1 Tax=Kineosporia sp. NBRC 101731 TaxID=3032199 RepID=UPI0024A43D10|nr:hypothetical protein [Kineosporia sp. NBRC 101731]GLY27432.1 hypothetical protein Kisp02_07970 [Kineosporia sp. NBRC 101731]